MTDRHVRVTDGHGKDGRARTYVRPTVKPVNRTFINLGNGARKRATLPTLP
jgi:hypothetical protein